MVFCRGSSGIGGGVAVELLLLSCFVSLSSWVILFEGTSSSSSCLGIGSEMDGKGNTLLITLFLFLIGVLIFLPFLGTNGDACSIYHAIETSWTSSFVSIWLDAAGGTWDSTYSCEDQVSSGPCTFSFSCCGGVEISPSSSSVHRGEFLFLLPLLFISWVW